VLITVSRSWCSKPFFEILVITSWTVLAITA
jgi:hypothetical protein